MWHWLAFFGLIVGLLALDLGVFHRESRELRIRAAVAWTLFWISLGLIFSAVVYVAYDKNWEGLGIDRGTSGADAVWLYLTGYVLEKSLSIDNIFVISLLFTTLKIPARYQHRVLFWGILGAVVFRAGMIASGSWLVQHFSWTFYLFGVVLAFSGIRLILTSHGDSEPDWFFRLIRRFFPVTTELHGGAFTTRINGALCFTPIAVALISIELSDVVFAIDSVPAVLAITPDPFIVLTSNVFAILGLRSLYFVLASMINRFRYLSYALALLLVIIGVKLFVHDLVEIPHVWAFVTIVAIIAAGVLVSLLHPPPEASTPTSQTSDAHAAGD